METKKAMAGCLHNGIPYNRMGHGEKNLIIFQGLVLFENKPLPARLNWIFERYYRYLEEDYTIYLVLPKHGLQKGYSLKDIADDYATMIREEFGSPVDIIGVSTGGSIAQHFAADHSDLVRKLIIHSSAYTLSESAKQVQLKARDLANLHEWRAAYAALFSPIFSKDGAETIPVKITAFFTSFLIEKMLAFLYGTPKDPTDFIITVDAEDKHNFKDRLKEISMPTLVVAGADDPYYSEGLFRDTANGIPNAKQILYKGMGHPAGGDQFRTDVLNFLREE